MLRPAAEQGDRSGGQVQNRGRHRRPGAGQGPVQEARCRAGGGQGGQEARWGGQLLEGGGGRAVGALGV